MQRRCQRRQFYPQDGRRPVAPKSCGLLSLSPASGSGRQKFDQGQATSRARSDLPVSPRTQKCFITDSGLEDEPEYREKVNAEWLDNAVRNCPVAGCGRCALLRDRDRGAIHFVQEKDTSGVLSSPTGAAAREEDYEVIDKRLTTTADCAMSAVNKTDMLFLPRF